jgi:putative salt-induced outer membrane protein YdiY
MNMKWRRYAALALFFCNAVAGFSEDLPKVEPPKWKSSLAFGLTMTRGNSETFLSTLTAATVKKWGQNELGFGVDGAYGTTKDQNTGNTTRNANSAQGFSQYNRLFDDRWYGFGRVAGLYDGVADINYRVTLSAGVGYYIMRMTNTDLSVEAGPGYVFEKLGGEEDDFATLRLAERFNHALSDHARVWEKVEYLPSLENFSKYIVNGEIGIEADLSKDKKWALRAYLQDTYNSVPATGHKNNDMKLIAALAYKF